MQMNITEVNMVPNMRSIDCSMSISSPQSLKSGIWLNFSVQNNQQHNIELLSWYTPFEGFLSNLFKITEDSGALLNYQGMMVKRLSPQPADFLLIPAHTRHEIKLDVSKGYSFSPGEFTVELVHRRVRYKNTGEQLEEFICPATSLMLEVKN